MKGCFLFLMVLAFSAFSIPDVSGAFEYGSGPNASTDAVIDGATDNPDAVVYAPAPNAQGYAPEAQASGVYANGNCFNTHARFRQGLSFAGSSDWLPKGAICLTYSDNYRWVVSDYRVDCFPVFAGVSNRKPIELIRCYSADYYHILGTPLIMSIPRPQTFL